VAWPGNIPWGRGRWMHACTQKPKSSRKKKREPAPHAAFLMHAINSAYGMRSFPVGARSTSIKFPCVFFPHLASDHWSSVLYNFLPNISPERLDDVCTHSFLKFAAKL
jgi:hypothetical protein